MTRAIVGKIVPGIFREQILPTDHFCGSMTHTIVVRNRADSAVDSAPDPPPDPR
jgi:hypothetical protein